MGKLIKEGKFNYVEIGNGPPIIILHGLMGGLSNFAGVSNYFPKNSFNESGHVLLDSFRENETDFFLVLDGTDSDGSDAGGLVASEEFGNTLVLDGTDSDKTDANSGFLLDDETGDGNILLDATASGVDVGDEILLETKLTLILFSIPPCVKASSNDL